MKVKRVFVEKRAGFDLDARRLQSELADFLGAYPELAGLRSLRILNRYDTADLDDSQFETAVSDVFSEPQCDRIFTALPSEKGDAVFAIEYLPGQYNQRSDSAEQCLELAAGIKPLIRSALVYILQPGDIPISQAALDAVKRYLINPVDSREAAAELPQSLEEKILEPGGVPVLDGFISAAKEDLEKTAHQYRLAMSIEDLQFCRDYFSSVNRDPSLAELQVLDTYWSDHCRHTTFNTVLEKIEIDENQALKNPDAAALKNALDQYEAARREVYGDAAKDRPRSLMDMAVIGAKLLRKRGLCGDVDESKEINACTIKISAEFSDGSSEPWLLLFKNETHNHPTEIEPFGGAATCLGGAIRDPLSGRAYVHQAMRISGGGDPRVSLDQTLPGKLPQVKIAREAAAGYASYGNQIGLATGQVAEFYHPGFLAKRLELGGVIGAVPASWVRREEPAPGDLVILAGGKTGRDGIGGATGSSKVHTGESVETAGAEVQKGNAVEERKLQRLFRNPQAARLIKRCNDFGAGGVSVAVGELAPGLDIDLDKVPKKYAGLNGAELAISESQERMAVLVEAGDANAFISLAAAENLDAVVIAKITEGDQITEGDRITEGGQGVQSEARLRMSWRGKTIVDLSRKFLDTNGASRSARALLPADSSPQTGSPGNNTAIPPDILLDKLEEELRSLRSGSRRGLQERFDGSIGAASVLFPWGGKEQGTPECGMAALLPSLDKNSLTASLMSFGYDPCLMEQSPYEGAKGSVREALAKFACLGGDPRKARLSFQEYFERPQTPQSWGRPAAALLGALEAQLALGVPAIGGKDSMSGNYRGEFSGPGETKTIDIAVPPTLAAFAAGTASVRSVCSGALSGKTGNILILLAQSSAEGSAGNEWEIFKANMDTLDALRAAGWVRAAYPVSAGGVAASLSLMAFGNTTGLEAYPAAFTLAEHKRYQGSILIEIDGKAYSENPDVKTLLAGAGCGVLAARTIEEPVFRIAGENQSDAERSLAILRRAFEESLAKVYPQTSSSAAAAEAATEALSNQEALQSAPKALQSAQEVSNQKVPLPRRGPIKGAPLAVLPVFPGTNCEWDMERVFREAGAETRLIIFRNRNREDIAESIRELASAIGQAHILALSGGFSAGDEPEGSGKFIANVLRAPAIADAVNGLIEKQGLILGICNGFQALIKTGLVPYGAYRKADSAMPTLTFNRIGRHVSRMVRTKVMSVHSPWLSLEEPGSIHILPVSHGEGRLVIRREEGEELFKNGQVSFCYTDAAGRPAMNEPDNPNGSDFAIEGLTSPDGRILGKMGHSERRGEYVHINIPGNKKQNIFEAGVKYFK